MNEKTIEDALNLLISGELDLVDTALGEVSNIKTYAEAGILTRDSGLVLRMEAEQMSRNRPARAVCRG